MVTRKQIEATITERIMQESVKTLMDGLEPADRAIVEILLDRRIQAQTEWVVKDRIQKAHDQINELGEGAGSVIFND